jgi:hypothetical protein
MTVKGANVHERHQREAQRALEVRCGGVQPRAGQKHQEGHHERRALRPRAPGQQQPQQHRARADHVQHVEAQVRPERAGAIHQAVDHVERVAGQHHPESAPQQLAAHVAGRLPTLDPALHTQRHAHARQRQEQRQRQERDEARERERAVAR